MREGFRSVWSVEVLLLLKSNPERGWAMPEIDRELRASATAVTAALRDLERARLIVREPREGGRYSPAEPQLADLVDRLERAYRERPVSLINLITKPGSAQGFADAFRFRGPQK